MVLVFLLLYTSKCAYGRFTFITFPKANTKHSYSRGNLPHHTSTPDVRTSMNAEARQTQPAYGPARRDTTKQNVQIRTMSYVCHMTEQCETQLCY